jgi:isoquinoline 1-oxidoreductase beta subunit
MYGIENITRAPSRRALLKSGLAAGFTLAFHLPVRAANEPEQAPDTTDGQFAPNAFIRIDHAGKTTLVMPQAEMGQGVYTAIAMILADELDADYTKVELKHAPPSDKLYANPIFGIQVTGNSNSIRAFWKPLRQAGAAARAMLVQAAAQQWQVDPSSCSASNGTVSHAASGRTLAYGDLVDAAGAVPVPKDPPLKDPKDFKLIGKPLKRFDTPSKVNGSAVYGIDAMLPGMKFATIAACPVFGGKVGKVDDKAAKAVPGVRQVIVLDDLVAIVGDHMWAAKKGLDALNITWDEGPNAKISSADIWDDLRAASKKDGVVAKSVGDIAKGLAQGERLDGEYELPFLAHATMEPMNCVLQVTPDSCEIWIGTQVQTRVQQTAAKAAGLPIDKVTVHNHLLGGGFGRRLEPDMAESAVRIAKHVDGPIFSTTFIARFIATLFPQPCRTARSRRGNIASPVRRSWRAGLRQSSSMASTSTRSIAPSTCLTTFRTARSNMCAPSRLPCQPAFGVALDQTTTSSPPNASWTNWRARRARIRSSSAAACSTAIRA